MQINRLLEIVYLLLRQKTVTARELAERFGVSMRTIYRDVDALSLAGIPVCTEKGKNGGIGLMPGFVMDKSILSDREQTEILTALQGLSTVKSGETDDILKKLSAIFNKNTVNWLDVDFTDWSYTNGEVFSGFKAAILGRRIAEFDYFSSYGEKTSRRVEPVQLWFKHRAWYVKAYCLTRRDVRLFKLTRVKNLTVTEETFGERNLPKVPEPDPNERPVKPEANLKLYIAPEMAYRVFDEFDESCVEKLPDGGFAVTALWPEDDWVFGTILSYGEYMEVLEPERIRRLIGEKARIIAGKYL